MTSEDPGDAAAHVATGPTDPVAITEPGPDTTRIASVTPDVLQDWFVLGHVPTRLPFIGAMAGWLFESQLGLSRPDVVIGAVLLLAVGLRLAWLLPMHRSRSPVRVEEILVNLEDGQTRWWIDGDVVPAETVRGVVTLAERGRCIHHVYLDVQDAPRRLATFYRTDRAVALGEAVATATGLPHRAGKDMHSPIDPSLWGTALLVVATWAFVVATWQPWFSVGGGIVVVILAIMPGVVLGATRTWRRRRQARQLLLALHTG